MAASILARKGSTSIYTIFRKVKNYIEGRCAIYCPAHLALGCTIQNRPDRSILSLMGGTRQGRVALRTICPGRGGVRKKKKNRRKQRGEKRREEREVKEGREQDSRSTRHADNVRRGAAQRSADFQGWVGGSKRSPEGTAGPALV